MGGASLTISSFAKDHGWLINVMWSKEGATRLVVE